MNKFELKIPRKPSHRGPPCFSEFYLQKLDQVLTVNI